MKDRLLDMAEMVTEVRRREFMSLPKRTLADFLVKFKEIDFPAIDEAKEIMAICHNTDKEVSEMNPIKRVPTPSNAQALIAEARSHPDHKRFSKAISPSKKRKQHGTKS